MEIVENRIIQSECVDIDNKEFRDCGFIDCVLQYCGGPVIFQRSHMRGCRYVFFEQARATVHFLQAVGLLSDLPSEWGEIDETLQ